MGVDDTVWQSEEVASRYLRGIRGAIPGAALQLEVMMRLLQLGERPVNRFLDLGCGDGVLGATILTEYPGARGVFVDFSDTMIAAARERICAAGEHKFHTLDYGESGWTDVVGGRFDCVVSGFSIHHQPDERKKEIYREIFDLLEPGGWFINVEHVQSATSSGEKAFLHHLVDNMYSLEQNSGGGCTRAEILHAMENNEDSQANILQLAEVQCGWLREIGFCEPDCYFKIYELAVFGGYKPAG